jgi:hypothetical protein
VEITYTYLLVFHSEISLPISIKFGIENVKKGKVFSVHAMKAYKGLELQLHSFLTSALDVSGWS